MLASLKEKTAAAVAHALVSKLFLVYSTPRVLLSDNGTEFRNALLSEIQSQYNITQMYIITHHPASNELVERSNRKILLKILLKSAATSVWKFARHLGRLVITC